MNVVFILNRVSFNVYSSHPSRTFLIILLSVLSSCVFLLLTIHLDEHRYCNNGIRYLPQKSTNLMCSTRSSKNTPDKVKGDINKVPTYNLFSI